jgi:N-acetyl sugar amidotransferase
MKYCARCFYPENAKPTIIFDEYGVCSGCRYHESRSKLSIDWPSREIMLKKLLDEAKEDARKRGNSHDCIIPVSGGKDSHYQVWLLKEKYGMNPLLVTFNHCFNSPAGLRNLENLVEKSGCDMVRYTIGLDSVRRVGGYMLEKVGDITWHYHAGIYTYPIQAAAQYNIPLIVWGEHGFAELTGLVSMEDFVEFTRWSRKQHNLRGYEPNDLIGHNGISISDIRPFIYPDDQVIMKIGIRGIYLSNFVDWDGKKQAETMIKEWGFSPVSYERDRTFNLYSKIEDHANDVHDFQKFLKFGYGRATDDASMEIRHGRLSREDGLKLVKHYDHREPSSLEFYCDFFGIKKHYFYQLVDQMRDPSIWARRNGEWEMLDAVHKHAITESENLQRVIQSEDRTLGENNRHLYYNFAAPPLKVGSVSMDTPSKSFKVM